MRPAAHPLDPLIAAESEGKALEEIVAAADASHVDPHLVDAGARQWEEAGKGFFDLDNLLLGRGLLMESSNLVDIGPFPSDCSTFD